jgi:hypothetical protein
MVKFTVLRFASYANHVYPVCVGQLRGVKDPKSKRRDSIFCLDPPDGIFTVKLGFIFTIVALSTSL